MFPVLVKVPALTSYSSALLKYEQAPAGQFKPPATSTVPLFSIVALCKYLLVFRFELKPVPGTLKAIPLLFTPLAFTTTFPVVAPKGTVVKRPVSLQIPTVAAVPLKLTVPDPCVDPKFVPRSEERRVGK